MGTKIIRANIDLNTPNVLVNGPALEIGEMDTIGFEELGLKLKAIQGHTVLWWGDWGNAFMEQHSENQVKQVAELLDMEYTYISKCMGTAKEYNVSVRTQYLKEGLSPSHLLEARTAPSPTFALDHAAKEEMSVRDLRTYIRNMKPKETPKEVLFQWIKDNRIIRTQMAFKDIARMIEELQTTNQDMAMAQIYLIEFGARLSDLQELIDD